jgi:tetratricopeptide (TPR) repeat protein
MRPGAALVLAAGAALGCGAHPSTERVFDGHTIVGPYIEPEAYAAFAEGVYREEHGDFQGALRAYRRARALDAESPGISVRIAALLCRTDLDAALAELDTSGAGRDHAAAWLERGRCLRQHGQADAALPAARRAVMLDDSNADANLLVAQLLREGHATPQARAWLFAWLLTDREAAAHCDAIQAEARQLGDDALAELARATARAARDPALAPAEAPEPAPLERARQASTSDPALALAQAKLVLGANPGDGDALVIALSAAHRLGDEHVLAELLREAAPTSLPAPEQSAMLIELLRHRTGDAAADAWAEAFRAQRAGR